MTERRFILLRGRFWLTVLKLFALVFVASMILIQIPELGYDFGPKEPVEISGPEELTPSRFSRATFVSLSGTPNFDRAFIYRRYGLSYTYFQIESYGTRLVVRTYEEVDDDWETITQFVGKLRPFGRQPFSYRIRDIYLDRFQEEIPQDAYFLALYDVPKTSGWQIGAVALAAVMWVVMFYMFFFFRRKKS